MTRPIQILLQTTIPQTPDDWSIERFSLLARHLRTIEDGSGKALFEVTSRNRDALGAPDSVLSILDTLHFNQLWLFAVDVGDWVRLIACYQSSIHFISISFGSSRSMSAMDSPGRTAMPYLVSALAAAGSWSLGTTWTWAHRSVC